MLTRWSACRASGEVLQYETRVRRADGQYLWFLHRNVPQWDDRGNIVTWYGSSIEIDDRKRAEEELKKAFDEIKTLKDQLHKENLALKEEILSVGTAHAGFVLEHFSAGTAITPPCQHSL